jgi:hypothetical protein
VTALLAFQIGDETALHLFFLKKKPEDVTALLAFQIGDVIALHLFFKGDVTALPRRGDSSPLCMTMALHKQFYWE